MKDSTLRKIIHIDMDAFYAAIEQRDNPALRGKPVVVGGKPNSRSVVATASYEARKFGIHSAMSCSQAYRLCPKAIFVPPRFHVYKEASKQIMEIFRQYTDLVEPLSLDEAYLDVTESNCGLPYARDIAKAIRADILRETHLTASAGVAPNKFLAKIASDLNKPCGLAVIPPSKVDALLMRLSVRKVPGIGKVMEEKMNRLGIVTIHDLRAWRLEDLQAQFGKSGSWYYNIARGIDNREVVCSRVRKSIGCEDTFAEDISDVRRLQTELRAIAVKLVTRLERTQARGRTVTLKATYPDFEKVTRSVTVNRYVEDVETLYGLSQALLEKTAAATRAVRLLGIQVSNLDSVKKTTSLVESTFGQLSLPLAA